MTGESASARFGRLTGQLWIEAGGHPVRTLGTLVLIEEDQREVLQGDLPAGLPSRQVPAAPEQRAPAISSTPSSSKRFSFQVEIHPRIQLRNSSPR
ncbi:MAG TPA: hypothetical protein VHR38_05340 [Solirubrobacterales bacterium]|nr:hypothetical protein [Solirubrobacterales bacterium]